MLKAFVMEITLYFLALHIIVQPGWALPQKKKRKNRREKEGQRQRKMGRSWWTEREWLALLILLVATAGNELMKSLILFSLSRVKRLRKGKSKGIGSHAVSHYCWDLYTHVFTLVSGKTGKSFHFLSLFSYLTFLNICGKMIFFENKEMVVVLWNSI